MDDLISNLENLISTLLVANEAPVGLKCKHFNGDKYNKWYYLKNVKPLRQTSFS